MDAEREREIRNLTLALAGGTKHRKIALVLIDLLREIDELRERLPASVSQSGSGVAPTP